MKKIYLGHGYNSWTNKHIIRAFSNKEDAEVFINGLTDPHLQVLAYQSTDDLVNALLNQGEL